MQSLFGLVFGIPSQRAIIEACCFKTCGKIIVGAVDAGEHAGALCVCRTPAEACPQLDRQMDEPMGDVQGDPLFLRKLKE